MKLWTTLNEILKHNPCGQEPNDDGTLTGFLLLKSNLGEDYGDDTPITLAQILESNGVADAAWALRCGMDERFARHLACDFAEHVLHIFEAKYPDDDRPRKTIEVSRRYADGLATDEELAAASDAAWEAVREAASDTAGDVGWGAAMFTAAVAAWAAEWGAAGCAVSAAGCAWSARGAEREWQAQRLRERYADAMGVIE